MSIVEVVICARNEEEGLAAVLGSLDMQTLRPATVVVVNDGSTDRTAEIAREWGAVVIDLPYHEENHAGTPEMAKKFNKGFEALPWEHATTNPDKWKREPRFVMIQGADDPLISPNYIKEITKRMLADPTLVVASGQADNERSNPDAPRGSGRLVKGWFWKSVLKCHYPESWAWEDYINYKAKSLGFITSGFPDLKFHRMRLDRSSKKGRGDGRSMYELGHSWVYVIGRCVKVFFKSPKASVGMFWGWLTAPHIGLKRLDVAPWVNKFGWRKIRRIMRMEA